MFCVVQCTLAISLKHLTLWNIVCLRVICTAGNRKLWLPRRQRKEHGWTTQFRHLPDGSLMPYYSCSCLHNLLARFFCLKSVWRSANYLAFIRHSTLHKLRLHFTTHFGWLKVMVMWIHSLCFFWTAECVNNFKIHWLALGVEIIILS